MSLLLKENKRRRTKKQYSSDDDHISIATYFKPCDAIPKSSDCSHQDFLCTQSLKVGSTSKVDGENSKKRKSLTTPQGISHVSKKPMKVVTKEVKKEVGFSVNEPIDIDEVAGECHKEVKELAKGVVEGGKRRKTGDSLGNPIDLENYIDIETCGFQKEGPDMQRRIERLEKLMGVSPD